MVLLYSGRKNAVAVFTYGEKTPAAVSGVNNCGPRPEVSQGLDKRKDMRYIFIVRTSNETEVK